MNTEENTLSHIHLTKDDIIGVRQWKGDLDLLNIFLISLTGLLAPKEEQYKLHRLLGSLLSSKLSVDDKLNILANDYHIPIDAEIRKDVNEMYTLSQAVREEGYAKGHVEGRAEGHAKGRAEEVYSSIIEGDYSIRRGMEKLHVQDEAAFRKEAAKAGFILPEE